MKDNSKNKCPCSSNQTYEHCCEPYHKGVQPKTALALMRSRYAAYALNLPKYIIKTTHPANPQYSEDLSSWEQSISEYSTASNFNRLEILDSHQKESTASVTFIASITQGGKDQTFTEQSYFEQLKGEWLYKRGELVKGRAPKIFKTHDFNLLALSYYGDPILREKAKKVTAINAEIKQLVEAMVETMKASHGVGLAAPQIHHSLRLFITCAPDETNSQEDQPDQVKVFINPEVSSQGSEKWTAQEGCLSIPNLYADVERSNEITVKYTDLKGKQQTEQFSGWEARIILHEYDHIEGVLFIDHLSQEERLKLDLPLKHLKQSIHGKRAV